ncbi:Metallo-hydrolase/oxidoreductase [Fomes fomentarius]|nr:Metallo-hydrolase/oxidoreductase [Fomes fomentarius]
MCRGSVTFQDSAHTGRSEAPASSISLESADGSHPDSAFKAHRLTDSTFLIVEFDDVYDEHPFIYAKFVPAARTILLLDTGCGGKTEDPHKKITSLREFIERVLVENLGVPGHAGRPSDVHSGGEMRYVVVLTHCHYDHILGVEQFAHDSPVIASGYDPEFLSPAVLPEHSLCNTLGIPTPSYTPSLRPHLHLALWDEKEGMLYVGDTLYEWAPIIFPNEGSIVQWLDTVDALLELVQASGKAEKVKVNCGHKTANTPALEVLQTVRSFMVDVIEEREPVKRRMTKRGEEHIYCAQRGGRYSLVCPERLVKEARDAVRC